MEELSTMYPAQPFSPSTILSREAHQTATEIYVSDSSVLPDGPCYATIGTPKMAETILYQSKEANRLKNVTRGVEGQPRDWQAGDPIGRYFTAADHSTLVKNITALAENGGGGGSGQPGMSAYEAAQKGGFIGTEEEFYAALAGVGTGGGGSVDSGAIGDISAVLDHLNGIVSAEISALEAEKQAIDTSLTSILGGELF